jgi:uncharacterized membrane-anchored protein
MRRQPENAFMHFKIVPAIGPRYWVSIAIASICGANLGDATVDMLELGDSSRLAMLGVAFAVIVLANRWNSRGNEVLYWLAILVVRAAATSLADIGVGHASYMTLSALLAAVLGVLVRLRRAFASGQAIPQVSYADGSYWGAMLVAGTLGTVIGDGIGHTIHPVTVGVPISAMITGVAVALILGARTRREASAVTATYWGAIVAIRACGTNLGDITAFLLSLPISITISALLLAATLIVCPEPSRPVTVEATEAGQPTQDTSKARDR